eukprot:2436885-Rhodomonas_salina.1
MSKEIIEALATDSAAAHGALSKGCWLHGTNKHSSSACNLLKASKEKGLCLKCGSDDSHKASD